MFLKSIEIRGFKSFADRTELIFTKGITSIVGPNGSGKSNISDAVRWVLGEQSIKNLRGGKMEDVIFSGTQFRKPLGLCQVSLNLDNEDKSLPLEYTSVTITRRIYRSGESEYYINNTRCRLKDIYELFMDTGIGKEGYSIIGQGKIDAVLSGKPEDRRRLLEEAAGIVKFKWRKEEAEKKLKNTDENLMRIEDILSTYRERLEPLRIENEKANRFLELSEGLKEKEINLLINLIDKLQIEIDDLDKIISEGENYVKKLNSDFAVLKCDIDRCNKELSDIEKEKLDCEKKYYDSKSKIQKLHSNIDVLKEKISNSENNIEKIDSEYGVIKNKLSEVFKQKYLQEKELSDQIEIQKKLSGEIEERGRALNEIIKNICDRDDLLKKLKDNQIEYLSSMSNIKNNMVSLKDNIKKIDDKDDYIKRSCSDCENSIKINNATISTIKSQIEDIEKRVENDRTAIEKNKSEIKSSRENLKKYTYELKRADDDYMKATAGLNMLANLEKQYEGYNRSSKILMKDIKSGRTGVNNDRCFLLGEIIEVEKKFEIAVEIALGAAISNIITLDDNIAKKLIDYLKANNLGRATFLPLNIIKNRKISESRRMCDINGYLGIASDIVNYDSRFENAVGNILGRTIISEDLDSALKIAKATNYTMRIVTLKGEVVNAGGSMTGGSLKSKMSNVLGRKRQINDLKNKIKAMDKDRNSLSNVIGEHQRNIQELDELNLNLKDDIYSKNIDIVKFKEKINTINSENIKLKKNMDISKKELLGISRQKETFVLELENKKIDLKELNLKQETNNKNILDLEKEIEGKNSNIDDSRNRLTEIKVEKAKLDENIMNRSFSIERICSDIEEMELKIDNLKVQKNELCSDKKKFSIEIENNKNEIKIVKMGISELEQDIDRLKKRQISLKEKINYSNENSRLLAVKINKQEEKIHKHQISLTKLSTEKKNLNLKLNSDLEITYEKGTKYRTYIENIDVFKKKIDSLKKEISNIGAVNLGAIEEYRGVKEKVDFMSLQKEDLVNGGKELENVITEMTEKMRILFNKNFEKLRKNFNETFIELFKGGSADLKLTEGDELTGNIEITVQPPGKKLQNINLMSGGEKGLSAIALLFAILKMKPTPFCILDEIEAALDDVNVSRYAEFLKRFSANTQFIIITHRKGTMEASDVMYGVTMEEKGVSKVVSVDLSEKAS
ncbi:MAG: chromosome segregation protein SMC [Clostridium sp.]|jgi:chromosome segregation protein|uniref:chromosome segregation protein SMC n=1 Tax=Clostridium sp. TaxID=1506 RepID=UPI0025C5D60C|nr:chromosome segregation protein SMC [Clostridium sp.]MCH3964013.1 chromosome segregation protein SMC [Clostridium sp.]MCI1716214.1 chromosome segregation protein SMC [Clostridium sp.]MCI1800546.1 chromosome segregation protein SMC [Clostridium sp.]MCI1814391.1 chromosome segregation protein SMC [Clostridium sp.]MCI1871290.1 chromosome segregation protein SMC [Clostridium sp.]